jgi:CRP-like cAMP-binding protein
MIVKGGVEVVVNSSVPERTVARLGPGQFFGEISLTTGRNSIAGVRTENYGPTELALISKDQFMRLLQTSPRMSHAIEKVAQVRMDETQDILERFA